MIHIYQMEIGQNEAADKNRRQKKSNHLNKLYWYRFVSISLDACEQKAPKTLEKYRQVIGLVKHKYELAKQNAEYLSTPVSYLKVTASTKFLL